MHQSRLSLALYVCESSMLSIISGHANNAPHIGVGDPTEGIAVISIGGWPHPTAFQSAQTTRTCTTGVHERIARAATFFF